MTPKPARHSSQAESSTADATRTQATETITKGSDTGLARAGFVVQNLGDLFENARKYISIGVEWVLETVTKLGWVAFSFAVLWFPLGIALGWPEFLFVGSVSFFMLLFAIPYQLGKREYRVDFDLLDEHMEAGESAKAPFLVTNTNTKLQLPGVIQVTIGNTVEEFAIPMLRPAAEAQIENEIPPQPRGVLPVGPFNIIRTDPIGVLRRETKLAEKVDVFVYPKTVVLPRSTTGFLKDLEGNSTKTIVESDLEFYSVRKYVPGDNPKHIHWKATAKLGLEGEFLVRQYVETRRSRMVVMLAMGQDEYLSNSEEFEVAVSAVGSLGKRALMDSRDISIYRGDEIPKIAKRQFGSIKRINIQTNKALMEDLCRVNLMENALKIRNVCQLAVQMHNDISMAVIVVGSTYTQRQLLEIRTALPNNIGVVFVRVDHTESSVPKYSQLDRVGVVTIQEIQDLAGLFSRYRG